MLTVPVFDSIHYKKNNLIVYLQILSEDPSSLSLVRVVLSIHRK